MATGGNATFSVIGGDVTVKGNIVATADLHLDGRVEGDIACESLVQGPDSVIRGAVTAQTARLSGTVEGSVDARVLVIQASARIIGDVTYESLTIEQGSKVDGRFSPRQDKAATVLQMVAGDKTDLLPNS